MVGRVVGRLASVTRPRGEVGMSNKPRIALCLSGQPRNFESGAKTIIPRIVDGMYGFGTPEDWERNAKFV